MKIELTTEWGYIIVNVQDNLLPLHKFVKSLDHIVKGLGYNPKGDLGYTLPILEADYEISAE